MTVEKCKKLCLNGGFAYAGVQYFRQCFCGDTVPTITATNCNMKCDGNRDQISGGFWAMNVYSTSPKTYSCEHPTKSSRNVDATLTCVDGDIRFNKATDEKPNPDMCVQNSTKDREFAASVGEKDHAKAECDDKTTCIYRGKNDSDI